MESGTKLRVAHHQANVFVDRVFRLVHELVGAVRRHVDMLRLVLENPGVFCLALRRDAVGIFVIEIRRLIIGDRQPRQQVGLSALPSAFVFPSKAGALIEPRNVVRAFKRLLAEAGLPTTTRLYDLRHGFASLLLAAGEHPKVVADLLGHSTTRLTLDTYSHVLPELTRQAADRLDAILARERLQ